MSHRSGRRARRFCAVSRSLNLLQQPYNGHAPAKHMGVNPTRLRCLKQCRSIAYQSTKYDALPKELKHSQNLQAVSGPRHSAMPDSSSLTRCSPMHQLGRHFRLVICMLMMHACLSDASAAPALQEEPSDLHTAAVHRQDSHAAATVPGPARLPAKPHHSAQVLPTP